MVSTNKNRQQAAAKKKAKRNKKNALKNDYSLNVLARNKYPKFVFHGYDEKVVSPEFVSAIKQKLKEFDFESTELVTPYDKNIFKQIKKTGIEDTIKRITENKPDTFSGQIYMHYSFFVGTWLYKQLEQEKLLETFLPFNDCQFVLNQDYGITLRSLAKEWSPQGFVYYSQKLPRLNINGNDYIVSFSKHALERIAERCVSNWLDYGAAGDVFSYIYHCTHYEYCEIENEKGGKVPAFSFYDSSPLGFFKYNYAKSIFQPPSEASKYYYRVGYCPIGIHGNYAKAITLLTPGMNGTPECLLVDGLNDQNEKKRLRNGIQNLTSYKQLVASNDFYAVKWFHEHGIPQVIETNKELYNYK